MDAAITTAHRTRVRVAMTIFVGGLILGAGGSPAVADDSPYPSASAEPPVEVDANDSDLKLPEGATLAPPKVLDIKSVVEDLGGEERREDTNADIKFALQAEVLFGKDSAKLSSDANSRINAIAAEIKNQDAKKVRVFGFTDNLGSSEHGDVLSKERAEAVHNVLDASLAGTGITFEIRGYGEQYPIADNSSEEGRKKNRRVEVSFQRTEGSQG
ncbi:Outer membrane protein OmpA [Streptomyces sp. BpilaLS-43]|uniref:OmpA family protein n=1 Tax=Streptomyces sp. BpilaLS-43 TaxID=1839778 RepID=UPI00081B508F|nr:OmpA family protein [Streptomyces sp. BpilaLS-43]SCD48066.1 Outer membrane protein OmpA [Streptomyces sp. BpilaLS-43]